MAGALPKRCVAAGRQSVFQGAAFAPVRRARVAGHGGAAAGIDMEIFFAKSVNNVAPTTLGDTDAAITLINATACRNNIIGHKFLDGSAMENSDELVGYNS